MRESQTPEPSVGGEVRSGRTATVELTLSGMHCGSCVELIREALEAQPGVVVAVVDLDPGVARVRFDTSAVTVDDLCAAVLQEGYVASPR